MFALFSPSHPKHFALTAFHIVVPTRMFSLSLSLCLPSAGKERLSAILGVSAEEASRFQDSFLQKYKEVPAFIQCTVQHCHKYGACLCVVLLVYNCIWVSGKGGWCALWMVGLLKSADGGCRAERKMCMGGSRQTTAIQYFLKVVTQYVH